MSTESSSIASDAPPTPARARPLLASIAAKDPRSAAKKELKKPGSFALGSPVKPPSGSSGSGGNEILSQLLASMARSASVDEEGDDLRELMPAVVKVFTTHTVPNYSLPWQMRRSMQSTSTGFIISHQRILTNAHSVEHFTQVRLRRRGSPTKYIARVVAIGRDCDIALLTVDDPQFWRDSSVYIDIGKRRKLPRLEERVSVVGYPVGGENLSVSAGVVSRIDMQEYANGIHDLLAVQVDAPINPGNSGGPVFDSQRRFVGIAFQSLTLAEGVGYIIPLTVIQHFLEDLAKHDGRYTGFPSLMLDTQGIENPSLRKYLGVPEGVSGVLVIKVEEMSPCKGKVKEGDVLTEIDGHRVGDDQTVEFPAGLVVGEEEEYVDEEVDAEEEEKEGKEEVAAEATETPAPTESAQPIESTEATEEASQADDSSQWEDVDSPSGEAPPLKLANRRLMDTLALKRKGSLPKHHKEEESEDGSLGREGRKIRFVDDEAEPEGAADAADDAADALPLGYTERIDADFLITQRQTDDSVILTLFNKSSGFRKERIQLAPPNMLVPPEGTRSKKGREDLKLPSYRIVGGVVLTAMTEAYLSSEFGSSGMSDSAGETPIDLLALWTSAPKRFADEEVVLCAQMLAHDSNVGYEGLANMRLTKINGAEVRNLKQASKALDEAIKAGVAAKASNNEEARFIRLDFAKGPICVIDSWTVEKDTEEVLEQNLVPKDRSDDLE